MPELPPTPGPIPVRPATRAPSMLALLGPGPGALVGLYLLTVTVGAGTALVRALDLSSTMTAMMTVVYLVAGVLGAPIGWLLGRRAPDAVAITGAALLLIGAVLDGLASAFPLLMTGRVVSGLATGALVATAVVLVRRTGIREAYAIASAAALAALVAGAVLGTLLTPALGWRTPFLLASLAAFVAVLAAIIIAITGAARH